MSNSYFTPDTAVRVKLTPDGSKIYFQTFLTALDETEKSRKDLLVHVKNITVYPVGDLSKPVQIHTEYTDGDIEQSDFFYLDDAVLLQIAQLSQPPMPIAWFRSAFNEEKHQIVNSVGRVTSLQIDLRQQILQHIFNSRPRLERLFRQEIPYVRHIHTEITEGDGLDTTPIISLHAEADPYRVMGVVGKQYPVEWSTYKMMSALGATLVDTFDDWTVEVPYMTASGTYRVAFYSHDSRYKIEPRVGDVIAIGGVIRDNPYGRESIAWYPRMFRLSCLNGAVSSHGLGFLRIRHDKMQSLIANLRKTILLPRRYEDGAFINEFEANLPEPEPVETYISDNGLLYDHVAQVMIARLLGSFDKIKDAYEESANLAIKNYQEALDYVCDRYEVGIKVKENLINIIREDHTINDPELGEFTLYDLSNAFTRYAQGPLSEEQRHRYEQIGGELIANQSIIARITG